MSEAVVDVIEFIDVDQQERKRNVVHAGTLHLRRELPAEKAAVGNSSQIVHLGETENLLPRAKIVEKHRELRRENLHDASLVFAELRRRATNHQDTGRAILLRQDRMHVV